VVVPRVVTFHSRLSVVLLDDVLDCVAFFWISVFGSFSRMGTSFVCIKSRFLLRRFSYVLFTDYPRFYSCMPSLPMGFLSMALFAGILWFVFVTQGDGGVLMTNGSKRAFGILAGIHFSCTLIVRFFTCSSF